MRKVQSMKIKSKKATIIYFLNGCKRYFAAALIFAVILVFFEMVNPKVIGYLVDYITGETEDIPVFILDFTEKLGGRQYCLSNLWIFACIVVLIALVGAVFRYLFSVMNVKGAEKLVKRMHDVLYEHIIHLPFSWHDKNSTGDIIQRCTSDVDMVRAFISDQMTNLIRMSLLIVVSLVFMWRINIWMAVAAIIFIPPVIIYSLVFHNRIGASFEKVDTEEGRLSAIVQENLTGVRVVRAFGREKYEKDRFEAKNEMYTGLWVHMMKILSTFWGVNDVISGLETLTVIALGSWLAVSGNITAGGFVAFAAYNLQLIQPVKELGRVISEMSKAGVSIERLRYIINSETEDEGSEKFPDKADIKFEHVSFAYHEQAASEEKAQNSTSEKPVSDNYVINDISLEIKQGQTIGILGSTGSGKSTLMQLLDEFYELCDGNGRITIGGIDVRNIKKSELRRNIGFVLQEPYLFSGTLEENIRLSGDGQDKKSLEECVKMACLDETIDKFNAGFDTLVGERGVTLSGGQKQRTAIAQMLMTHPKVMIFDDSLSALDIETDERLRENLKKIDKETTVIIISHRISSLKDADNIFVIDKGKIAESGTHVMLMENGGIYAKTAGLQHEGDSQIEEIKAALLREGDAV